MGVSLWAYAQRNTHKDTPKKIKTSFVESLEQAHHNVLNIFVNNLNISLLKTLIFGACLERNACGYVFFALHF
ncbi:MAG: hypothetical protein NZ455_12355 [Bacteroidia bacterium]|nr:hypothetical protein [Bacteroidia bacterium]MDW8346241.1 hypothetical protein [Bacteroidia bacterium]